MSAVCSAESPRRIIILAFEDILLLDLAGPSQVFSAVLAATRLGLIDPSAMTYELQIVSRHGGLITTDGGIAIQTVSFSTIDMTGVDTVIVPGGWGVWTAKDDVDILDWIRSASHSVRRVVSICLGAFILANAGLLKGRRATTHWFFCKRLAADHPDIEVAEDSIFIKDGEIYSSAGVSAGIDLSLSLIEEDMGHRAAAALAQFLVLFLRRDGGQAQFSRTLAAQIADSEGTFSHLHHWIADNLDQDLQVEALAKKIGMTPRTFARTYREETGMTPAKSVELFRVEAAKRLFLDNASLTIKEVAQRCGFMDEERMRRSFLRVLGVSLLDYRSRFAASGLPHSGRPEGSPFAPSFDT